MRKWTNVSGLVRNRQLNNHLSKRNTTLRKSTELRKIFTVDCLVDETNVRNISTV